jgi:uncharacterized iron-regulated membrane protein
MRTFRSIIFWLHLAMGCIAGLVIFAMSITGVLLAYERQISNWINAPAVLQDQSETRARASLDMVLTTLASAEHQAPSDLILHKSPQFPLEARYGRERILYLSPWTGEVIGQPSEAARAFFGTVEQVHRSVGMGMQSPFGRGATGAANLIFLFILISGSYLWLPKAFSAAALKNRVLFRSGLKSRAREWNWHHAIGIWAIVPLLFIVASGVIMSYPWASNLLYKKTRTQPPARMGRGGPQAGGGGRRPQPAARPDDVPAFHGADEIAMLAQRQVPDWNSITISIPAPQERVVSVSVDKSTGGHPEAVVQLALDRQSGRIQSMRGFSDNDAGQKLRAWARFLHTGEEFGVFGETIAALASLGGVFLFWTGISMAIRRAQSAGIRSRQQTMEQFDAEEELQTVR